MNLQFKSAMERLKSQIRDVPDFPKPGIVFRDITPVLGNAQLFRLAVNVCAERYQRKHIDKIAAIDARGFLFAGALAHVLGVGLVPIRKKGKLPSKAFSASYNLEYGENVLEIHEDAFKPGERIVIFDDILATGGTAAAAIDLVKKLQGDIFEVAFLLELSELKGRSKLAPHTIFSAIQY
ncbi:MAG: adenine phosphoribosyltransferase [Verrucomicrobiota bacterium]